MRTGFSRFGPPSASQRFHSQMRRGDGRLAMLAPTIFATLFLFVVVVTLNKASTLSRGGKLIRLLSVEEVFPSEDLNLHKKQQIWEQPTPPSPEAALEAREGIETPVFEGSSGVTPLLEFQNLEPLADGSVVDRRNVRGWTEEPIPPQNPSRRLMIPTREIGFPEVAPNTELPVAPTP